MEVKSEWPKTFTMKRLKRFEFEGKIYTSYAEVNRIIHLRLIREMLNHYLAKGERIDEARIAELLLDTHDAVAQILNTDIRITDESY